MQDVVRRFTLDAACEFLFDMTLQTLDSKLTYPHTKQGSGSNTPASGMTREEAFSEALFSAEAVVSGRLNMGEIWFLQEFFKDKSEPHMEVINRFLNPILEEGLAKHAARTKAGLAEDGENTLLDSLLQETTGQVAARLYCSSFHSNCTDREILRDEILNMLVAGRDSVRRQHPISDPWIYSM